LLPDLSVLWVVFFVLLLTLILDRLFFRPLLAIIKQREDAVSSAKALADQAAAEARRATEEFDRQTATARAEVYRQMDEMRRAALDDRAALVDATRKETEAALAQARADLARDVADARARLDKDADALAADAASQILGRRVS
jgi:F0F1-type ATP synthase membrane subunit b/b'